MYAKQINIPIYQFGNSIDSEIYKQDIIKTKLLSYFNECTSLIGFFHTNYLEYFDKVAMNHNLIFSNSSAIKLPEKSKDVLNIKMSELLNIKEEKFRNLFVNEDEWKVYDNSNELEEEAVIRKNEYNEDWLKVERMIQLLKHNDYYYYECRKVDAILSIIAIYIV